MSAGEETATRAAKDLFAGAAGGVAQVLIGQPFDIVKVRLQTSTRYGSALGAATSIWRHEGPRAFYKGTLTPLLGIGACVSIQFGAFHQARRWFESRSARNHPTTSPPPTPEETFTPACSFLAGAYAGIANSVLSAPIEHVRIRLQTQPHEAAARYYTGPLDCARKLGLWGAAGLYRGGTVTVVREAVAYGAWFLAFESLMRADARRGRISREEIPAWKVALYGGLAGEALWLSSYPLDVVKSKMQADGLGGGRMEYRTMRDCFAKTWRREGPMGFWRGIGPTLLRAMPVSAGTFAVVEMTMRAIK